MNKVKLQKLFWPASLFAAVFGIAMVVGGIGYFEYAPPERTCASCHEIVPSAERWKGSAHRDVSCKSCHGGSVEALGDNTKRVYKHVLDKEHENIRLSEVQVLKMTKACGECHRKEYADWKASGHGTAVYSNFFMNAKHNLAYKPADDCYRCHGMFYEGSFADMMTETGGVRKIAERQPAFGSGWMFRDAKRTTMSAIPCQACHNMHAQDMTAMMSSRSGAWTNMPKRACQRVEARTTDFYWRGIRKHVPVDSLCVQCHSPNAAGKPGTADDRTPTGAHAGISCVQCHTGHSRSAANSCVACHGAPGALVRVMALAKGKDVHHVKKSVK